MTRIADTTPSLAKALAVIDRDPRSKSQLFADAGISRQHGYWLLKPENFAKDSPLRRQLLIALNLEHSGSRLSDTSYKTVPAAIAAAVVQHWDGTDQHGEKIARLIRRVAPLMQAKE